MKKQILILTDYFLPCTTSGGPVITVLNMIKTYGDSADFSVICLNRDMISQKEFDLKINQFLKFGLYECMYIRHFNNKILDDVFVAKNFDCVYCLGTYSKYVRYFLLKRKRKFQPKIILAPMGNFSQGALRIKKVKKRLFFFLLKPLFLSRHLFWSFTSDLELKDGTRVLGKRIRRNAYICPDPVQFHSKETFNFATENRKLFVFISRICRIKGLLESIDKLISLNKAVSLDIYGSIEDEGYWLQCQRRAEKSKVKLNYLGELPHEEVINAFGGYSFFLFSTRGENFGHVIFEAINAGCYPIITPGVTPWDNVISQIQTGASNNGVLEAFLDMSEGQKRNLSESCYATAENYFHNSHSEFLRMIS